MNLEFIGLNNYEARAYETLIKFGKLTASEISANSEVPYGRVYDILKSLESKGLILVSPDKTKRFIPADPEVLKEKFDKKLQEYNKIKKEIENLSKIYSTYEKEPVQIAKGKKNFWKLTKQLSMPEKSLYVIKSHASFKKEWLDNYLARIKKGMDVKNLVNLDKETIESISKWYYGNFKNMRILKNKGVVIQIIDDKEILLTLIESNENILITDKEFILLMKQLFLAYYEQAPQITSSLLGSKK